MTKSSRSGPGGTEYALSGRVKEPAPFRPSGSGGEGGRKRKTPSRGREAKEGVHKARQTKDGGRQGDLNTCAELICTSGRRHELRPAQGLRGRKGNVSVGWMSCLEHRQVKIEGSLKGMD